MAIRDQSYTRYDGPLRERYSWAVIGWAGFRTYWRFWRTKLIFFAVWLVPLIFALLVIAEAALFDEAAALTAGEGLGHGGIRFYLGVQIYALALVFIANGCGIVSDDLRHRTVQLYFSKPITRVEYAAGKILTLFLMGTVTVLIPALLLVGLRTAFFLQSELLSEALVMHIQALGLAFLLVALMASIVIGLSSLTGRTGYAVLALLGLLFVPLIVQAILAIATDGSPWARMASISGLFGLAADALLGGRDALPDEIPLVAPFAAIGALIAAGLAALRWRITNLQGIA